MLCFSPKHLMEKRESYTMWGHVTCGAAAHPELHIQTAGEAPTMDSSTTRRNPALKPGHGQMSERKERNQTNKGVKEKL